MLKIRLQGTKKELRWFLKGMERDSRYEVENILLYPEHKVAKAYGDFTGEVIASAHCDSKGGDGNE